MAFDCVESPSFLYSDLFAFGSPLFPYFSEHSVCIFQWVQPGSLLPGFCGWCVWSVCVWVCVWVWMCVCLYLENTCSLDDYNTVILQGLSHPLAVPGVHSLTFSSITVRLSRLAPWQAPWTKSRPVSVSPEGRVIICPQQATRDQLISTRPVNLREGPLESPTRAKVCTNKIALQTCNRSACAHYPLLMFEIEHPINVCGNWGSGLSDFAPLRWLQQGPWLESAINFPFFTCCIVMEVLSFPAGGFGQRA